MAKEPGELTEPELGGDLEKLLWTVGRRGGGGGGGATRSRASVPGCNGRGGGGAVGRRMMSRRAVAAWRKADGVTNPV